MPKRWGERPRVLQLACSQMGPAPTPTAGPSSKVEILECLFLVDSLLAAEMLLLLSQLGFGGSEFIQHHV